MPGRNSKNAVCGCDSEELGVESEHEAPGSLVLPRSIHVRGGLSAAYRCTHGSSVVLADTAERRGGITMSPVPAA